MWFKPHFIGLLAGGICALGCGEAELANLPAPERRVSTLLTFEQDCHDVTTPLTEVDFRLACKKEQGGESWAKRGSLPVTGGRSIERSRIGVLKRGRRCTLALASDNAVNADWDDDGERDRVVCDGESAPFEIGSQAEIKPGNIELRCRFQSSSSSLIGGKIVDATGPGRAFFVGPTEVQIPGVPISLGITTPLPKQVKYSWSALPSIGRFQDCGKYPQSCSYACAKRGQVELTLTAAVGRSTTSCAVSVLCVDPVTIPDAGTDADATAPQQ